MTTLPQLWKRLKKGAPSTPTSPSFVVYLLSCNVGELVTITAAMLMRLPVILRPVHILWLNLVTDAFRHWLLDLNLVNLMP